MGIGQIIKEFQSTLPLRGATAAAFQAAGIPAISIHAPLAGSDLKHWYDYTEIPISIHAPLAGSDREF